MIIIFSNYELINACCRFSILLWLLERVTKCFVTDSMVAMGRTREFTSTLRGWTCLDALRTPLTPHLHLLPQGRPLAALCGHRCAARLCRLSWHEHAVRHPQVGGQVWACHPSLPRARLNWSGHQRSGEADRSNRHRIEDTFRTRWHGGLKINTNPTATWTRSIC